MQGKTETIGLVLKGIGEQKFCGCFTKVKLGIILDEFWRLTLKHKVVKTQFWCEQETGRYKTDADTLKEAVEVGRQLKKIGINNPILIYNGKEKPIDEWSI